MMTMIQKTHMKSAKKRQTQVSLMQRSTPMKSASVAVAGREAHLLVEQLPEPATVKLREWHQCRRV